MDKKNFNKQSGNLGNTLKWQFREVAEKYFQKAKVSLTASILKDMFSKINSWIELYHPFSLPCQPGLWAKSTKALKQ